MTEHDNVTTLPAAERTIPVLKDDHEGALLINAISGVVQQDPMERPEWADGLATALLAERHTYYSSRLGQQYADEHKEPEAFNFDDLGWIAVDAEGAELEMSASEEYRMEVIGAALGLDRENDTMAGTTLAEVELTLNRERTDGEVGALEETQREGFERKTGTEG